MYHFFVDQSQISGDIVEITGPDVNHMKNAVRLKPGDIVRISDGGETDYFCSIKEYSDDAAILEITERGVQNTELGIDIKVFIGIPKGDRMETVIEKAVELGATEIIPVDMRYCVVKLDAKRAEKKVSKWQELALTAAKQSKRSVIPKVSPVLSFKNAAKYFDECELKIVPYENENGMAETAEVFKSLKNHKSVGIFTGPEGGFAEEEIGALREGAHIISLGRRILRADTAPICMLSAMMLYLETTES